MTKFHRSWFWLSLTLLAGGLPARPLNAQTINAQTISAQTINSAQAPTPPLPRPAVPQLPPQDVIPIPPQTTPSPPSSLPPQLPPPGELLQPDTPTAPAPSPPSENVPETITVKRFEVLGSTVFSQQDFDNLTKPYTKRPLSLPELFEVRSKITELYVKAGYITSGAYIPPQPLEGGVVKIQVSEGGLEDIKVTGTHHLNPNYVRSRLAIATTKPLNQKRLLEALQLLQLNPLIKAVSAELSAGTT